MLSFDDRTALTQLLSAPHRIAADKNLWAYAALIAGLRTASNAERLDHRDRGDKQNLANDLQGIVGELVLLREFQRALPDATIGHLLLEWAGGASKGTQEANDISVGFSEREADVRRANGERTGRTIQQPGVDLRVEAKSHLHLSREMADQLDVKQKRYVAVNRGAILAAEERHVLGLVETVTSPGRQLAVTSRLVPLADALHWDVVDFGHRDLALAALLEDVSGQLWDASWASLRAELELSPIVLEWPKLLAVYHGAVMRFEQTQEAGFDLRGCTYSDLRERCGDQIVAAYEAGSS